MMHEYSNLLALQLLQANHAQCEMSMKLKMQVPGELNEMTTFEQDEKKDESSSLSH